MPAYSSDRWVDWRKHDSGMNVNSTTYWDRIAANQSMVRDLSPEALRTQPEPPLVAGKKRYREESPVEVSPSLGRMRIRSPDVETVAEEEYNKAGLRMPSHTEPPAEPTGKRVRLAKPSLDRHMFNTQDQKTAKHPTRNNTEATKSDELDVKRDMMRKAIGVLADWLDANVAGKSIATSPVRRQLYLLRALCRYNRMIPKAYLIPAESLSYGTDDMVARGGYGDVYKGRYAYPDGSSIDVAIKVLWVTTTVSDNSEVLAKSIYQEVVLWRQLSRHPRITEMIGVKEPSDGKVCIVSKWMKNGALSKYVAKHKDDPKLNRLQLLVDICEGLRYLHSQKIAHGDIKSDNIVIDENGRASLCDFGLTTLTHAIDSVNPSTQSRFCGTVAYMAPELMDPGSNNLQHSHVSLPADIFALAVVMWQIFSAGWEAPWPRRRYNDVQIQQAVLIQKKRPVRHTDPVSIEWGLTDDVWNLIERCWHEDWSTRPTIEDVLKCLKNALKDYNESHKA